VIRLLQLVPAGAAPVIAAALVAAGASAAPPPSSDGVWVDGTVDALAVTGPAPAGAHVMPLYVIAPVSPAHPLHVFADARTHGFGAHDHVIALAPGTTYHGACDLNIIVPGPGARPTSIKTRKTLTPAGTHPLLYAALLGGKLRPLTSAARITTAIHLGLAHPIDTHTPLACTITPRSTK
jgi:hypothetical protein